MKTVATFLVLMGGLMLAAPLAGFSQKSEMASPLGFTTAISEDLPRHTVESVLMRAAARNKVTFESLMQLWDQGEVVITDIKSGDRFTNCPECLKWGITLEVLDDI
jgi:hypothetical protein